MTCQRCSAAGCSSGTRPWRLTSSWRAAWVAPRWRSDGLEVSASQILGRFGVGLELRLGRHLVLDGQIAQLHRLRFDDEAVAVAGRPAPFDRHERATEVRGGIGVRF